MSTITKSDRASEDAIQKSHRPGKDFVIKTFRLIGRDVILASSDEKIPVARVRRLHLHRFHAISKPTRCATCQGCLSVLDHGENAESVLPV